MSDGEAPDQNFEVDKVLKHKLFDKMVEKALRSEVKFSPQSIEARESEHSKYAYLTVWEGEQYGIEDRTWEPEENFGENHRAIVKYKKKKNLPMEHEKIKKTYGREVWRHLGIAAENVKGIGYLMTKEEREKLKNEEEKLKKKVDKRREERMAKLAEISNKEIEKDQNRKQRQRMITPEDPEEVAKRPRKKKEKLMEMSPRSEELENESSSRSFEPSPPTTSESHQTVDVLVEKTIPTATPGITRLDPNTPRIQKISPSKNVSSMSEENQSLESISTCSSSSLVFKFANIDGEQVGSVVKRTEEEVEDEEMMEVESVTESAISTEEISTQEEEEEEIQEESQEDTEISDEEEEEMDDMDVAEAQQEYDALEHQLLTEFPVKIEVKRRYAEFPGSLSNRLLRKCQSTEMLNERWNELSEMEIFAKNFEQAVIVDEVQIHENVLREQSPPLKFDDFIEIPTDEQLEEEEQEYQEILAKNRENIEKVMKSQEEFQPGFYQVLDGLVEAFSTDDHLRFVEIFKGGFPAGSEYNALRYAAIVIILAHCDHRLWTADARGFPLFESDISTTELGGTVRNQEKYCDDEHRKCAWMRVFLTLIPDPMRFLETSGQCFHGWQGDDGPFRDDAYHWCMRNGAECQKQLFFEFSKPIGIQEDRDGDYMVDAMHLLAVQKGEAERLGLYMSTGGLDINALATHIPTNRVYRLVEYLELWVQTNVVERGADEDSVLYRHYKEVLEMVREAGDVLEELTENRLEMLILQRMRGRYRICNKLTYAHILRCSPMNNVSNLGDGTHQVLTCLFSPGSIGLRDGVYNERTQEVLSTEELGLVFAAKQKVDRFRHVVSQRKGQLVVALLRVDVHYETEKDEHCRVVPPTFQFVHSDQDFKISKLSILRQSVDLSASEADIALDELKMMSSPGEKYYRCLEREDEQKLILPGNAHIEVTAEVDKPISFVVQAFFVKRE